MSGNTIRASAAGAARSLLSLGLNFSSDPKTRQSKLWRAYGHLLLREIGYRHNENPNAPDSSLYVDYEQNLSAVPEHMQRFQNIMAKTGIFRHLINTQWLENLLQENPQHYVIMTSLLRRVRNENNVYDTYRNRPGLTQRAQSIDVQRQNEKLPIWDYTEDQPAKPLSRAYLGLLSLPAALLALPKTIGGRVGTARDGDKAMDAVKAPLARVRAAAAPKKFTSEDHIKAEGWLHSRSGPFARVAEALRNRQYSNVMQLCEDVNVITALTQDELVQLVAMRSYFGVPTLKTSSLGKVLKDNVKAEPFLRRGVLRQTKREMSAKKLFSELTGTKSDPIRSLWLEAETHLQNDDELAALGVIEDIAILYGKEPQNRMSRRRVSFDTFLVTKLDDILEKAKSWLSWHDEKPSVLLAFAHCAVLAGKHDLSASLFRIIEDIPQIKPPIKAGLEDAFLGKGIHSLATFQAQGSLEKLSNLLPLGEIAESTKTLCLVESSANIEGLSAIKGLSEKTVCAPVQPADALKFPESVQKLQIEDFIPMYSKEDMELSAEVDKLTGLAIEAVTKQFNQHDATKDWADFVEILHATVFFSLYRDVMSVKLVEKLMVDLKKYDQVVFLLKNGKSMGSFIKLAVDKLGAENVYFSVETGYKADQITSIQAIRDYAQPAQPKPKPEQTAQPWQRIFGGWMANSIIHHQEKMEGASEKPYALHLLEHVNGYFDSYVNLIKENLAYSDVELVSSTANKQLNDYVAGDDIERFQEHHTLTRRVPRTLPPAARDWMPSLISSISGCYDGVKSPLFPQHRNMIAARALSLISLRLAQTLDIAAYLKARFDVKKPTHIFTGNNQHLASRAACIWGKKLNIPSYDFLILANTNHPRYRPPVADIAYLYDGWYKDIYENYFGYKPENIRVSGPLFDYSSRLSRRSKTVNKARGKEHIVFFSQSGNFDVNRMVLEDVCKAISGREDVYLTVKLHPHESHSHVDRYKAIAKKLGLSKNISIWHRDADAIDLVNQADLVVQSYSNIGLDSFLLGKPVITVKFSGKPHARIFLYEKGVGKEVKTRAALRKAATAFLDDPKV